MAENTDLKAFADATKSLKDATKNIGEKDGVFGTALKNNFSAGFKALSGPFAAMLGPAQMLAKITMVKQIKDWALKKRNNAREEKLLRDQLGLSKEEYKDLAQKKKIADANKKWADSLGSAAENLLGADASRVKELIEQNATLKEIKEGILGGNKEQQELNQQTEDSAKEQTMGGARQAEKDKEEKAERRKEISLFQQMADGINDLNESFLASLKEKAELGLGIIAALIAAPINAIVAFFSEIAKQIRWMKAFTGAKFGKLFAPIKLFFSEKGPFGKAIKSIKGVFTSIKESKFIVGLKTTFTSGWTKLKNFLKPISDFFKTLVEKGKMFVEKGKTATKIVTWAKTFGRVLGKIFLPITLLMGAWDLITGAIAGWEKEGEETDANFLTQFIAAIGGGLSKFVKNLIGIPLGWLTSGIAWIMGKMGFDSESKAVAKIAEDIPQFISDLVSAPFDFLKAGVKWLVKLFTSDDPVAELKKLWTKLVGAGNWAVNAIGKGLNSIWEFFKGLFDIDFAEIAKAIVPDWAPDFIKEAVGIPVKKKTVGELEKELKAKEVSASVNGQESEQVELKKLRAEIETLKRQNQATAAGGDVNVNASTNVKGGNTHVGGSVPTRPDAVVGAVADLGAVF